MGSRSGFLERPYIREKMGAADLEEPDALDATILDKLRGWKQPHKANNAALEGILAIEGDDERLRGADNANYRYSIHQGCLASGGDLFHEKMTIADAKVKCSHLP